MDSYKNPDSVSNIIVPITNVMNDNYCYQTSKKIRQVFDYKRRNGQYIGAFAPYGYVKHPKDKHRLIVDPDAAENVKLIFTMLIQGSSKRAIALYLNEHGVPSPSAYKVQKGLPVSTRGYDDPMWGARMIHSILTNPTYTGDLAQGRSRVKSYKVHQIEAVPREEWVEVAGTHEAIIDYETFDKVQALLQRDTRTSPKGREVHLFSGFMFQNPDNQIVANVVEEDVAFGPENLGVPTAEIRRRVDDALAAVGMEQFASHAPHLLSGGQKQRIAIAGILAMEPKCIVLDEATAMLDPAGRREVIDTVLRLNREQGITVVLITHHMVEAERADRVIVMNDGEVAMDGMPRQVFSQVERLHELGLAAPDTVELLYRLRQDGVDVPLESLTVGECADTICRAFGGAEGK